MIDWDYKEIEKIEKHYNQIFPVKLNLSFFMMHYEEIYRITCSDMNILPDLLDNIAYYTSNGVNAKHKIILHQKDEEKIEKLYVKRFEQRERKALELSKGLSNLYEFQINEIRDFIKIYPQWKNLMQEK